MNINQIKKNFETKKVLIIGDVMIDRYEFGAVNRISPEAPVPVLEHRRTENRLGGAANVALNIKAFGAIPILISVVGDDEEKNVFFDLLKNENIKSDYIFLDNKRPTTVKTRFWASGQQLLRVDKEKTDAIPNNLEKEIFEKINFLLQKEKIDVIIFQDYNKGFLTPLLIRKTISIAKKYNIPTAVDPKKDNFDAYIDVTLFKPNLKEISSFLGEKIEPTREKLKDASLLFSKKASFENMMITLSEKGIFIYNSLNYNVLPTYPRNIADVCGAGDAVIAVASLGLASELSLEKIATIANIAGGQVCEEIGVVQVKTEKFWNEVTKRL